MSENSIIMFKIGNQEADYFNIYHELCLDIEKVGLHIDKQEQIRTTPNLIEKMWATVFEKSFILKELMWLYLQNKQVTVLYISGEDAIEKVRRIKGRFRERYASDAIRNILHAPNSYEESVRDIEILSSSRESKTNCIKISQEAKLIYERLLTQRTLNIGNKYGLELINRDDYSISGLVEILSRDLGLMSISDAYYTVLSLGHSKTRSLVLAENCLEKLKKIQYVLSSKGISTEIVTERDINLEYAKNGVVATKFGNSGMIDKWLFQYLKNEGANVIADEFLEIGGYLLGVVYLPICLFKRCCGPEKEMHYYESRKLFETKVHSFSRDLVNGADFPPLLLRFCNMEFELYDGAHRYEMYKRNFFKYVNTVIWFPTRMDYETFMNVYYEKLKYQNNNYIPLNTKND